MTVMQIYSFREKLSTCFEPRSIVFGFVCDTFPSHFSDLLLSRSTQKVSLGPSHQRYFLHSLPTRHSSSRFMPLCLRYGSTAPRIRILVAMDPYGPNVVHRDHSQCQVHAADLEVLPSPLFPQDFDLRLECREDLCVRSGKWLRAGVSHSSGSRPSLKGADCAALLLPRPSPTTNIGRAPSPHTNHLNVAVEDSLIRHSPYHTNRERWP